jgi:hypothetical protein
MAQLTEKKTILAQAALGCGVGFERTAIPKVFRFSAATAMARSSRVPPAHYTGSHIRRKQ